MPDDDKPQPRRLKRSTKIVLVLIALIVWTGFAAPWSSKGCNLIPQSYFIALTHGNPERWEGCSGGVYTSDYQG
jgi:hypothetical protein